jgi:hypothetical protein
LIPWVEEPVIVTLLPPCLSTRPRHIDRTSSVTTLTNRDEGM